MRKKVSCFKEVAHFLLSFSYNIIITNMTKFLDDECLEKDFFVEVNARQFHISSRWRSHNGSYFLDRWGLDEDDQSSFDQFVADAPFLTEIMSSIRIDENGEFITLGRGVYDSKF